MVCGICRYEWCWACGMCISSKLHLGGFFCAFIGKVIAKKGKKRRIILAILLTFAFPFILLAFAAVFGGLLAFLLAEFLCKLCFKDKLGNIFKLSSPDDSYFLDGDCLSFRRCLYGLKFFLKLLVFTSLFLLWLAFALCLGAILYVLMFIPCLIYYFFALYRVHRNWRKRYIV